MTNSFWHERRDWLLSPQGIVTPYSDVPVWYPFTSPGYTWGRVASAPDIAGLRAVPVADLVVTNPYAISQRRRGGRDTQPLAIWDSVFGIPRCDWHTRVVNPRMVGVRLNTNKEWHDAAAQMNRLGRIGGYYERPNHPNILDLLSVDDGWRYLELAHALAHLYTPPADSHRRGTNYAHMIKWLAYLAVARRHGIPVKLPAGPDDGTTADIDYLGLDLVINGNFRSAVTTVPVSGPRAPMPDATVALLHVNVHIEPHPAGITWGTDKWVEVNRWACAPALVALAGWECVDVITKLPLYSYDECAQRKRDLTRDMYGIAVPDLNSISDLRHLVAKACEAGRVPTPDGHLVWRVEDLIRGPVYDKLLAVTPPLPCAACMRINMGCEGVPDRPVGKPPDRRTARELDAIRAGKLIVGKEERSWIAWHDAIDHTLGLVEKAVDYWQGRQVGHTAYKRSKRARKAAYKRRMTLLKRVDVLRRKRDRTSRNGRISELTGIDAEIDTVVTELAQTLCAQGEQHE